MRELKQKMREKNKKEIFFNSKKKAKIYNLVK